MTTRTRTAALLAVMLLGGCEREAPPARTEARAQDPAFLLAQNEWRARRREDLIKPDGWTSLVGLHRLQLKAHYIGSSTGSGIRLAVGPPRLGMVARQDKRVYFTPESGVPLTFNGESLKGKIEVPDDRQPQPGVIGFDEGKGVLTVIERGGEHFLRIKHADADGRLNFHGLDYWNADPAWRIEGRYIPHPPNKTLPIVDIIGVTTPSPNPGAVEFERDGVRYRLEAMRGAGDALFFVIADRTSGHGSYPAGRFLDAAAPVEGKVVLDFNQAYNPPCAFTPFATCPLPPPENRLDLAITAGEKTYTPRTKIQ